MMGVIGRVALVPKQFFEAFFALQKAWIMEKGVHAQLVGVPAFMPHLANVLHEHFGQMIHDSKEFGCHGKTTLLLG